MISKSGLQFGSPNLLHATPLLTTPDCHGGLTMTAVQVYCAELSIIYFVIRVTLKCHFDTCTIPMYV